MLERIDPRLRNIQYHLLPGKPDFNFMEVDLYNRAYQYWRDFWNNVFKDNGTKDVVSADSFSRQDMIACLTYNRNIVGMHLYSKFDLCREVALEHSYIRDSFNQKFIDTLLEREVHNVVSLEYLTVDPSWRKKEIGVSLGSIILGLAVNVVRLLNGDAAVGPTRADIKVTDIARDFGGEAIVSGVMMHNTPCDLTSIILTESKLHPEPVINSLIDFYWKNKIDLVNASNTRPALKVA